MLNFIRPTREKSYLRAIEEHALEQLSCRVDSGRIARAQLAVDLKKCVVLALHRVLAQGGGDHVTGIVAIREEDLEALNSRLAELGDSGRGQLMIRFDENLAGRHVDHVGGDIGAFQIVGSDFHLLNLVPSEFRGKPSW